MILRNRKIYLEKVFSYQEAGRIQTIRKYGQLLKEEYREDGVYRGGVCADRSSTQG